MLTPHLNCGLPDLPSPAPTSIRATYTSPVSIVEAAPDALLRGQEPRQRYSTARSAKEQPLNSRRTSEEVGQFVREEVG